MTTAIPLHWYHRSLGFRSPKDLNFFSGFISTTAYSVYYCKDYFYIKKAIKYSKGINEG